MIPEIPITAGIRALLAAWLKRRWEVPATGTGFAPRGLARLATAFYARGLNHSQKRALARRRRLPGFTVSVGNLVVGGTGKTPMALWLAQHFTRRGQRVAILSRGYGRGTRSAARVSTGAGTGQEAARFGDEPVLLAMALPEATVWVGRDRFETGTAAVREVAAGVFILDDGFQHLSLHRDVDLVLLDTQQPFGNGALLPAGPLREPPHHLARASAILLTHADDAVPTQATRVQLERAFPALPVFACRHRLAGVRRGLNGPLLPVATFRARRVVAFAGIGRPDLFFSALSDAGLLLAAAVAFSDHHRYRPRDLEDLEQRCRAQGGAPLITTAKDAVRLPQAVQRHLWTIALELEFAAERDRFTAFLDERLDGFAAQGRRSPSADGADAAAS
jgi:tetraacyldisaccharide 4'-kinase